MNWVGLPWCPPLLVSVLLLLFFFSDFALFFSLSFSGKTASPAMATPGSEPKNKDVIQLPLMTQAPPFGDPNVIPTLERHMGGDLSGSGDKRGDGGRGNSPAVGVAETTDGGAPPVIVAESDTSHAGVDVRSPVRASAALREKGREGTSISGPEVHRTSRGGARYVPGWRLTRDSRLEDPSACREFLRFAVPDAEREYFRGLSHQEQADTATVDVCRGLSSFSQILKDWELQGAYIDTLKRREREDRAEVERLRRRANELESENAEQAAAIVKLKADHSAAFATYTEACRKTNAVLEQKTAAIVGLKAEVSENVKRLQVLEADLSSSRAAEVWVKDRKSVV